LSARLAVIVGSGGVLGTALAHEFTDAGYDVRGLRRADAALGPASRSVSCDLRDPSATQAAVARFAAEHEGIDVLICNAAQLTVAPFAALSDDDFDTAWRVGVGSVIGAVRAAVPGMVSRRRGSIIVTGATGSLRGSARFAAFSAAKFALRGLAQSLAREYQPHGVHVAHVVIDGVLKDSPSVARFGKDVERTIEARDAARSYRWLAEQPPSAWTHEVDLRSATETF
jgi:NAD(P)-dependent dehydrogenase (short-subunit alcohol dehydrogenase family)